MSNFTSSGITLRWSAAAGAARAWSRDIRRVIASALVAIGVLFALFAGVFRYVDQHFYTPETFLENNSELAANADIREFLFQEFRDEIIQLAEGDVEAEEPSTTIAERLAEEDGDVGFDPITQEQIERDQAIETILLDVFDSELYETTFSQALSRTQLEIVRSAELESSALLRDKGEIFFNMQPLYTTLWPMLAADERTADITRIELPNDYGLFKVADRETTIDPLWTLIQKGPDWRGLMTLGAVLSFIGAVAITDRRPSSAIQFGGGMVGVGVVVIVIIFLIRFIVPLLAGGSSASPVVANYVANTWPLVSTMIRLAIFGAVIAAIGAVARFIWPDNWVYSSVSDERGVRSIKRRRGEPEPASQQPRQQAAAVPVGYPGYPQQPYGGYPQQWVQPYPGQYPPGYIAPYPVGPYAQPQQQQPQQYTSPGQPTVPVMPVNANSAAGELVAPVAPPFDATPGDLPADAAQIVPRVVATADTTLDASTAGAEHGNGTGDSVASAGVNATVVESVEKVKDPVEALDEHDEWATEKDW